MVVVGLVIAFGLAGSVAAWGLVAVAARRLHRSTSPARQSQTRHQVRVLAWLVLASIISGLTLFLTLKHVFHVRDGGAGEFFLWMAVFAICLAPVLVVAARYGRQNASSLSTHTDDHA